MVEFLWLETELVDACGLLLRVPSGEDFRCEVTADRHLAQPALWLELCRALGHSEPAVRIAQRFAQRVQHPALFVFFPDAGGGDPVEGGTGVAVCDQCYHLRLGMDRIPFCLGGELALL